MRYLLAAEADRIQDLLFRSAQLREVVGGSQLLTRFCEEVPPQLATELGLQMNVITSGGGSFYLEFEDEGSARHFGAALAEAYYRTTGGTLSIAGPLKLPADDQYGQVSEKLGALLRRAKQQGSPVATTHIPYMAFCESCGVGLAQAHEQRFADEVGNGHYLCPACRAKAAERVDESLGRFLKPFYKKVVGEEILPRIDWPHDADAVGRLDPRNYVAYIIADGNGMGDVFHDCDKEQSHALSHKMSEILQNALAEPIKVFLNNPAANRIQQFIPALPLILGGDDLFALVPAPWALDIAGRLCRTFQEQMTAFAQHEKILSPDKAITLSAVVVICKANYPYYLAHQIGEERLAETKRAVKALAQQQRKRGSALYFSAVDFEVVLGSQIEPPAFDGKRRVTLRPYWVAEQEIPAGWGLPLRALLDERYNLSILPARRRSALRALLDRVPSNGDTNRWNHELERLLARVERDWRWQESHPLRQALTALGGTCLEDWPKIDRKYEGKTWTGHGMGDLLRVWDWAFDLNKAPVEYEGGAA